MWSHSFSNTYFWYVSISGVQIQKPGSMPVATATKEEPTVAFIHQLAREGLSQLGHHGPMTSMGVPRHLLPHWDDLQIMVAQMANKPLFEETPVCERWQ